MMNMANKDMSISSNYNAFFFFFDIDNFIDYWAAEIYIYNEDWPQNNYRLWRTRDPEPGNPYGDTKWRYQMFDTEFAMGIYNGGGLTGQDRNADAFAKILSGGNSGHHNNKIFKALLANPDFCKKFVNTMMDLYNVNFNPAVYGPKLNNYEAVYSPLMKGNPGYFSRWGSPWDTAYENKVSEARNYLNDIRNAMVYSYLPIYFGGYSGIANISVSGGNLRSVTLSVTGVSGASIKINTVTPNLASGNWTGQYYSGIPVTVTASAPPGGYEFDGWTVTGGTAASQDRETIVTLAGNAQITAKYKLSQTPDVPVTNISLNPNSVTLSTGGTRNITATVAPSNATYRTVFWNSDVPDVASVDGSGKITALRSGSATITASTAEGISANCTVTVNAFVTNVSLNPSTLTLLVGGSEKLTANVTPSNSPNKQTTWSSSNNSVAAVAGDGTVTAVAAGSATITVTTVDGNKTATCAVNVKEPAILLDLATKLNTLSAQAIDSQSNFDTVFAGLPLESTHFNPDAKLSITSDKKLKIEFFSNSGGGLNIKAGYGNINFQAGTRIEIKGTFTQVEPNLGFILNTLTSAEPWWRELQGWGQWSNGSFEKTFTLTQEEANNINTNGLVRINIGRIAPYDGTTYPKGTATIVLEQVKVIGFGD
jgi:uncharacterized protein YjdB